MGKVVFGLKNVKYAIWDDAQSKYGDWKVLTEGAISLTADMEANSTDFYAEDTVYAVIDAVAKESGSVEIAYLREDVKKDLLGYKDDETSGLTYVTTEPKEVHVALGYETNGNQGKARGVRYDVKFSMPSESANTMTESTSPDTVTLNYTAVGKTFTVGGNQENILKAHVLSGQGENGADTDAYKNFFDKVQIPGVSSASA